MATDKLQSIKSMSTRQKLTAIVVIVVVFIIIWQVYGMFRGSGAAAPVLAPVAPPKTMPATVQTNTSAPMPAGAMAAPMPQAPTQPTPAQIPPMQQTSPQEAELMRLQQESQARYIQAINELQMLKVTKDIADANKDISTSKLAQVEAEKKIVDLLAPPAPPPTPADALTKPPVVISPASSLGDQDAVQYTVVSVSQLQYRWGAIMSYKGTLFNVHVGDILPPDGSKVVSIQRDGVMVLKGGARKKISLVPTI